MSNVNVRAVQEKILEIIIYIDNLCRNNNIDYCIMGGTALGAVRHGGFIPWDDDLDIFMTPSEYEKFKKVFNKEKQDEFVIQEWRTVENYLEYAKVRMNGTTFIEEHFKDRKDMHHGIYVDIMILHKAPLSKFEQRKIYCQSKYVTLLGNSERNWKPKTLSHSIALKLLKVIPKKLIAKWCYKNIYKYDNLTENYKWCYYITKASFNGGLFDADIFDNLSEIEFEGYNLKCSSNINKYLELRYGNYMKLPSEEQQKAAIHAWKFDVNKDYSEYIKAE